MKKIKNIIFDLGNVLIEFNPEKFIKNNIEERDREKVLKIIFLGAEWLKLDRGTLSYEEAISIFSEKLPKYKESIESFFNKNILECLTPMEENIKVMKKLKKDGYNLYILSNFHKPAFDYINKNWDFFKEFNGATVSSYCKLLKPEKEIYQEIIRKFNLIPEETLFIDDTLVNIEMCEIFGIRGLHLKKEDELNRKIEEYLK